MGKGGREGERGVPEEDAADWDKAYGFVSSSGCSMHFFSFFHMADKVGPLWWDRMIVGEQEATLV